MHWCCVCSYKVQRPGMKPVPGIHTQTHSVMALGRARARTTALPVLHMHVYTAVSIWTLTTPKSGTKGMCCVSTARGRWSTCGGCDKAGVAAACVHQTASLLTRAACSHSNSRQMCARTHLTLDDSVESADGPCRESVVKSKGVANG